MTTLAGNSRWIWLGDSEIPANVQQAATSCGVAFTPIATPESLDQLGGVDLAVYADTFASINSFLERLRWREIILVELSDCGGNMDNRTGAIRLSADLPADQLATQLLAVQGLAGSILELQTHLADARKIASQAKRSADTLDEEMQLASRLQQDFLPRRLPTLGSVRFGVCYHPAGWVSGDLYDVCRLDETHIGFYVADAVGHGMPAALLTMFIKKALQTKRISGNSYELVPPNESLQQLNVDLCRQKLSMCEFCTAVYGLLNTADLTLTIARAGHPPPILFRPGQLPQELDVQGPLLGVMENAQFEAWQVQLQPGDRLVLYSDGLEDILCGKGKYRTKEVTELLSPIVDRPREDFLLQISEWLEQSGDKFDDATVLLTDIQP